MNGFVEWVAPGVARIRVPNPAGLTRNVYLLEGPTCALVDGAHVHPASVQVLLRGLAALGKTPDDIAHLFLTDIMPDRMGAALHPAFRYAQVTAHPAAGVHADYSIFTEGIRNELLTPLLRDRRLGGRVQSRAFGEALALAYGGEGRLRLDLPAPLQGHVGVGDRRMVPVPIGGLAHAHLLYRLEPDGLLFSGDVPGSPIELPTLLRRRGAEPRRLVAELRRVPAAVTLLPATGDAAPDAARAAVDFIRAIVQVRDRLAALLCGGPRELATLLTLWTFGRPLSPLALARDTATLLALVADLAAQGLVEEAAAEGVMAFRLAPRALQPAKRAA